MPNLSLQRTALEGASLQLRHEIVARAHAQRHDGERRILARIRRETGRIHDKKILDVVTLLELIENGFFRVSTHACDAGFV